MQYNDQKLKYLIKQTGKIGPIGQLEQEVFSPKNNEVEWLRGAISGLGGTPVGKTSDLWKQLLAISSLPVTNSLNANRKTYYQAND